MKYLAARETSECKKDERKNEEIIHEWEMLFRRIVSSVKKELYFADNDKKSFFLLINITGMSLFRPSFSSSLTTQ